MDREVWPARNSGDSRTERLLMRGSIAFFTAAGLILGLWRFASVLISDLQNPPSSFMGVLFLTVILAGVAVLLMLASAAVGFIVGGLLAFGHGLVAQRRFPRPVL